MSTMDVYHVYGLAHVGDDRTLGSKYPPVQ